MRHPWNIRPLLYVTVAAGLCHACSETDTDGNSPNPTGIDVSHFQGQVDWQAVKRDGLSFTYIKASEGTSLADADFPENWKGATDNALLRGAYHVFSPDDDGDAQADYFLSRLKAQQIDYTGALPPALDIEALPKDSLGAARPHIAQWLHRVEAALGCKPIIYTSPGTWDTEFPGDFTGYGLWLADYARSPTLPQGWKDWTFWQYSDTGDYTGVGGTVDLDRFNGTADQLARITCPGGQD